MQAMTHYKIHINSKNTQKYRSSNVGRDLSFTYIVQVDNLSSSTYTELILQHMPYHIWPLRSVMYFNLFSSENLLLSSLFTIHCHAVLYSTLCNIRVTAAFM